ncbi:MAG: peroxiredoxin-like family protein [Pseudomonadota bacterium]
MSSHAALMPREAVPSLDLSLAGGGDWSLADQNPENFTLVVFYRGRHCPICSMYLGDLNRKAADFAERGVNIVVASTDTEDRAVDAKSEWKLDNLDIAYGMTIEKSREWGLYVSTSRGKTSIGIEEPELFSEPGVFLIRPDGTLYYGATQTMPFARPGFADLLKAVEFAVANDYPARGEVAA